MAIVWTGHKNIQAAEVTIADPRLIYRFPGAVIGHQVANIIRRLSISRTYCCLSGKIARVSCWIWAFISTSREPILTPSDPPYSWRVSFGGASLHSDLEDFQLLARGDLGKHSEGTENYESWVWLSEDPHKHTAG